MSFSRSGSFTVALLALACSRATPAPTQPTPTPVALAFTGQPTAQTAGLRMLPAVQVTAVDEGGNRASTFNGAISIALDNNPNGGTLSGTTTMVAVNGIAMFPDLSIDEAASGYTLKATAYGLAGTTSASFAILTGASSAVLTAGAFQAAAVGTAVGTVPAVRLTDVHGDPVVAATVLFVPLSASGTVQGMWTYTDSTGTARPRAWILGATPGIDTLFVLVGGRLPDLMVTDTAWGGFRP